MEILDFLLEEILSLEKGKDLYFLSRYLGSDPFLVAYALSNNGMLLTIHNALANTEANGYLFVSVQFVWKLYKILSTEKFTDFEPSSIAGFDGKPV